MRDFRDAKSMAQALRVALAAKGLQITNSDSLELIAKAFGEADWNTLSAAIRNARPGAVPAPPTVPDRQSMPGGTWFSTQMEATLHRAYTGANALRHQATTLEHLLLALVDDPDASALLQACGADIGELRSLAEGYVGLCPTIAITDDFRGATPTAAFQRVVQRAVIHVQASGREEVTGAQLLVAILSESESLAATALVDQGVNRAEAVSILRRGLDDGRPAASA